MEKSSKTKSKSLPSVKKLKASSSRHENHKGSKQCGRPKKVIANGNNDCTAAEVTPRKRGCPHKECSHKICNWRVPVFVKVAQPPMLSKGKTLKVTNLSKGLQSQKAHSI